jgi:hypothetical protein
MSRAHTALGYSSWGSYDEAEFGEDRSRGYQLLKAAEVRELIAQSTIVDSPSNTRVSQNVARDLVPVLKDDPEQVEEVWAEVVEERGPERSRLAGVPVVHRHQNGLLKSVEVIDHLPMGNSPMRLGARAYQILAAGRVAAMLVESTNGGTPPSERVARELVPGFWS